MSIIRIPLRYEGSKGEQTIMTLFDSGSTFSCITPAFAKKMAKPEKIRHPKLLSTASEGDYLRVDYAVRLDFYIDDVPLSDEFMIVPGLSEEAILGVGTLQKWRIKLDFENDSVIVDPKVAKLILKDLK